MDQSADPDLRPREEVSEAIDHRGFADAVVDVVGGGDVEVGPEGGAEGGGELVDFIEEDIEIKDDLPRDDDDPPASPSLLQNLSPI
jgi:hypothetical protein